MTMWATVNSKGGITLRYKIYNLEKKWFASCEENFDRERVMRARFYFTPDNRIHVSRNILSTSGEKFKYRTPDEKRKEAVTATVSSESTGHGRRNGGRYAIWAKVDDAAALGNQDLHFSAEIGFAIKGFGIKFNSARGPAPGG